LKRIAENIAKKVPAEKNGPYFVPKISQLPVRKRERRFYLCNCRSKICSLCR